MTDANLARTYVRLFSLVNSLDISNLKKDLESFNTIPKYKVKGYSIILSIKVPIHLQDYEL